MKTMPMCDRCGKEPGRMMIAEEIFEFLRHVKVTIRRISLPMGGN